MGDGSGARPDLAAFLEDIGACDGAVAWAWGRAWSPETFRECRRPDWLIWLAGRAGLRVARAALACAALAVDGRMFAGEAAAVLAAAGGLADGEGGEGGDDVRAARDAFFERWRGRREAGERCAVGAVQSAATAAMRAADTLEYAAQNAAQDAAYYAASAVSGGLDATAVADAVRVVLPYEAVDAALRARFPAAFPREEGSDA